MKRFVKRVDSKAAYLRELAGFEALLRWQHPDHELTVPGGFLEMARELGLMDRIGAWTFGEASRRLQGWRAAFPHIRLLTMSINFSVQQFAQQDLVGYIDNVLSDTAVDPSSLKIGITKSDMMQNPEAVTEVLKGEGAWEGP